MDTKRLYHPILIGNVEISGNLFLAPLAGITDKGFREICLQEGADFTYTEMVSAEAVARGNEKTGRLMERSPSEQLLAIQLFMGNADTAQRAVERVLTYHPTIIDLNCGCPVPKVIKTGAGSALMRDPERIRSIIQVLSQASKVPVTAKIRLGWDTGSINYLEAAQAAVAGGAALITMHARTRSQGYSGHADWQALADLKSKISVPVIGSGDLMSAEDAKQMLEQTGIDGIMFARGAMGNPFIFSATRKLLTEGTASPPAGVEQRFSRMIEQLDLTIADKGEQTACKEMRKQFCAYTKGLPNASVLRNLIIHAQSREEYLRVLQY